LALSAAALWLIMSQPSLADGAADQYAAAWGPAVGAKLPLLQAPDQSGAVRDLSNLSGEQGLLLFLSRSADW
jgi:hypothetical protein